VEHVVIDGASTDGTVSVLESRRERIDVLVSERDAGIYDALNKGLGRATGEVVGLMHSDDFYADEGVLEKVAAAFADPDVDGVYGDLDYVAKDEPGRIIRRWRSGAYDPAKLAWGWMPPHPTLYVRRKVIEQWGGLRLFAMTAEGNPRPWISSMGLQIPCLKCALSYTNSNFTHTDWCLCNPSDNLAGYWRTSTAMRNVCFHWMTWLESCLS
jgi:glycosyltransferase involved in cell wall biosynthesis